MGAAEVSCKSIASEALSRLAAFGHRTKHRLLPAASARNGPRFHCPAFAALSVGRRAALSGRYVKGATFSFLWRGWIEVLRGDRRQDLPDPAARPLQRYARGQPPLHRPEGGFQRLRRSAAPIFRFVLCPCRGVSHPWAPAAPGRGGTERRGDRARSGHAARRTLRTLLFVTVVLLPPAAVFGRSRTKANKALAEGVSAVPSSSILRCFL
jgi:hypothetical protein